MQRWGCTGGLPKQAKAAPPPTFSSAHSEFGPARDPQLDGPRGTEGPRFEIPRVGDPCFEDPCFEDPCFEFSLREACGLLGGAAAVWLLQCSQAIALDPSGAMGGQLLLPRTVLESQEHGQEHVLPWLLRAPTLAGSLQTGVRSPAPLLESMTMFFRAGDPGTDMGGGLSASAPSARPSARFAYCSRICANSTTESCGGDSLRENGAPSSAHSGAGEGAEPERDSRGRAAAAVFVSSFSSSNSEPLSEFDALGDPGTGRALALRASSPPLGTHQADEDGPTGAPRVHEAVADLTEGDRRSDGKGLRGAVIATWKAPVGDLAAEGLEGPAEPASQEEREDGGLTIRFLASSDPAIREIQQAMVEAWYATPGSLIL